MQSSSQAIGISPPFEAYSDEGPYTFVSYAHADKVVVFDAMRQLHDRGANIWYDEGIKPAGEWVEEIAHAIKASCLFLVFISPRSVDSRYVKSEVGYALSENKEVLTVFVEETTLPAGLSLCLQQFQSVFLQDANWKEKALETIFEKMDAPVSFTSELVDNGEEVVDHGKILWDQWEKSRERQLARWSVPLSKKRKKRTRKDPQEYFLSPTLKPEIPASSKVSGSTRHPFATKVAVCSEDGDMHQAGDLFKDPTAGDFSWIPAGEISLKVPYSEETKLVRVKNGFWMSRLPITQDLYFNVMGNNPSFYDPAISENEQNYPVNNVSWLDAVSFCKALTMLSKTQGSLPENYEFRLPTEVEWEYSCRAGSLTDYYFGDHTHELQEHGWFRGNSQKRLHPVGLKKSNPWRLFDMYGNVREWVGNSFANTLLNDSEQDEFRISRGGAYMKSAAECKSSSRSTNSLNHRFRNLGFRPVLAKVPS
ncbi:MAG: SUMF1/EgtB/PvdO family nonheme iron enzyme [Opitutae bacterium]